MYRGGAGIAVLAFLACGGLLAITLPYHDYDSFAFGNWSRAIAEHGKVDPLWPGPLSSSRPLFYELQGSLWAVTGISFAAGRLLSLAFGLLLIGSTALLMRALARSVLELALAVAAVLAIDALAQEALAGKTDVPAAAMVAIVAALALRPPPRFGRAAIALAALGAVLTKQTVLVPLLPLLFALLVWGRGGLRARFQGPAGALAAGLALGLTYDFVMALRFHEGLIAYLRTGSTGVYAQFAAQARGDALLRADVLGPGLRLPLTFGLLYAGVRVARVRHRPATAVALAGGLLWSIAGPLAAGVINGPFETPEAGFTLVGFALILASALVLPDDQAPDRRVLWVGLVLAVPPLVVWIDASAYANRLAAPAWPGLAVLVAVVLAAGVRGLARGGVPMALSPIPVIALAIWMSMSTFDGLHGPIWQEYRALGWSGLSNRTLTMNVVLPAAQSALATAERNLGNGRLISEDPIFPFFLPGRVTTLTPLHCRDLRGARVFILLTADEAELYARENHGLATPQQWARCKAPTLHQLTDGSNGYAVFSVGSQFNPPSSTGNG